MKGYTQNSLKFLKLHLHLSMNRRTKIEWNRYQMLVYLSMHHCKTTSLISYFQLEQSDIDRSSTTKSLAFCLVLLEQTATAYLVPFVFCIFQNQKKHIIDPFSHYHETSNYEPKRTEQYHEHKSIPITGNKHAT